MYAITLTKEELAETKTALLLSLTKTKNYPFEDEETREIIKNINSVLSKISEME